MSSPPVKYLRYFDFTNYASLFPDKPLPGASVDQEYNRIKSTTDQTIDRLALIQNDDGTLRGNSLQPGSIGTAQLADGAVTTPKLADGAVTFPKIGQFAVASINLGDNAVDSRIMNANAVTTPKILDGAVTTPKIADGNVTNPKLAALCIDNSKLQDLSVTTPKIADGAITAAKIAAGTIGGGNLAPGSIGTTQLADGGVTLAKLAPNSVDSSKIVDGTIAPADLSSSTLALISSPGNPRGAWLTGTAYAAKDSVTNGSGVYVCTTAHTSGVFATDLASGKWFQTGSIFDQSLNTTDVVQHARLGIGAAPAAGVSLDIRLDQNAPTYLRVTNANAGNANRSMAQFFNGGSLVNIGICGGGFAASGLDAPNSGFVACSGNDLRIYTTGVAPILFGINSAEKMRLDSSGRFGVGRVPESWAAVQQPLCLGGGGSLYANVAAPFGMSMAANLYYDGSNWRLIGAGAGLLYQQDASGNGTTLWYQAPGGSAGAVATPFTERMRLDANGVLNIANGAPVGAEKLFVNGQIRANGAILAYDSVGTGASVIYPGLFVAAPAGSTNTFIGTTGGLSGMMLILTWNFGGGYALVFVTNAGQVTAVGSSNSLGGNNCFDLANNFASNGGNGLAVTADASSVYLQAKSNYSGGNVSIGRYR